MRYFVFGKEISPDWFLKAVEEKKIKYVYEGNHIKSFEIVETGDFGRYGDAVVLEESGEIKVVD